MTERQAVVSEVLLFGIFLKIINKTFPNNYAQDLDIMTWNKQTQSNFYKTLD